MALQEVLNSSIWVIKDDKSNYQPLYGQFLYTLNTDASGDDDKGMLYVGNGTEWINVMGTALSSVVENILATVPFEQIDNKTIFDAINEKANKATTLEGYGIEDAYTKTTIDAIILALEAELAGKQDKLTAGDNISIDGNKISVTGLTKASVGLDQVDNTSDADKPISTATQTALDLKADKSQVANISTDGNTTKIQGNLEVSEIDTGETGSVITGTLVAHGQVDVDSISVGASSPLDSVSTNVSVDSKDTEIPTAKATYTFVKNAVSSFEIIVGNKQDKTDNNLSTTDKTVVGAINEVAGELANKQDKLTAGANISISDANEISVSGLTKASVGLENVDNTSDANKPISTATQEALDLKQDKLTAGNGISIENNVISATGSGTVKSVNNVGPDGNGNVFITTANIPNLGISEDGTTITIGDKTIVPLTADSSIAANKVVGAVAEAVKATQDGNGDVISTTYAKATELADKQDKLTAGTNITISETNEISVTGLTKASVGLDKVDNTSDVDKPISKATQTALDAKQDTLTAGNNISITDNKISVTGVYTSSQVDGLLSSKADASSLDDKQDKLVAGTNITIDEETNTISATNTTYTAGSNISISNENAISVTGVYTSSQVDTLLSNKADTSSLVGKQDKLTAGSNITISDNNEISVMGLTKVSVGLDNVDNTSDANKPISTATQTALDAKQDVSNLVTAFSETPVDTKYPSEKLVYDSIENVQNTVDGELATKANEDATNITGENVAKWKEALEIDVLEADLGAKQNIAIDIAGIAAKTVENALLELNTGLSGKQATIKAGDNISIGSDGVTINVSGVVPEATKATQDGDGRNIVETYATIASLQTKQDVSNLVTTIDSTSDDTHYPSAKAVYDYAQAGVTSTVETTITPTTAQTATEIANALAKKARVVVIPSLANAGAIYIKESDTYSSVNPIYPDPTNNVYEFTNMQNVKVFVDSVGDSVDLVIEYRG